MRRASVLLALAAAALTAAGAQAQTQSQPAPAPVKPKIVLDLQKVGHVDRAIAFAGRTFRVRGTVTPFVEGQRVRVRLFRGAALASVRTKKVVPVGNGDVGMFIANFRTKIKGRYRMGVTHEATPQMGYGHVAGDPISVIDGSIVPGQVGFSVETMQRLLRDIGYVPGRRGVYDARTARAVLAFRKMSGLPRTSVASHVVLRRMINGGGRFEVRYPDHGHHVEGDISHQVLALIDGDRVERLYPMSSGKPSTPTVLGNYRVYMKTPGTNSHGMIHSSYFIRGYAIHGYVSVPAYAASHGCLRVPPEDAWAIYRWVQMGDRVDTYYRSGHHRHPKPSPNAGP